MQELWRKTAYLFWKRPSLGLPMLAAALLSFILSTLVTLRMTRLFLAYSMAPTSSHVPNLLLTVLISLASLYASYLRVPVFLATAQVGAILERNPGTSLQDALQHVHVDQVRAFWFAIQIFAAELAFGFMAAYLHSTYRAQYLLSIVPLTIAGFLFSLALAYWLTPSALKLLRPAHAPTVTSQQLGQARWFAMLSAITAKAIEESFGVLNRHVGTQHQLVHAMGAVSTLLSMLPYIALAIALGFIALNTILIDGETGESQNI